MGKITFRALKIVLNILCKNFKSESLARNMNKLLSCVGQKVSNTSCQ